MSDKELLELAAKAVGAVWIDDCWPEDMPGLMLDFGHGTTEWNPLANDGDALRLAVKLGIELCYPFVLPQELDMVRAGSDTFEPLNPDPYDATRRAIVRAAAEIGRHYGIGGGDA